MSMSRSAGLLIALVFFLFGAGAIYVLMSKGVLVVNPSSTTTPTPTAIVQQTASPTPASPSAVALPSPSPSPSPILKAAIKGTLGYPSEGIPPMQVYAMNTTDNTAVFSVKTPQHTQDFTISNLDPGTYYVFAYPQDTDKLAGGYTKAVPCGLSVECTDHSLIPVVVAAGKTVSGIEVKDWYAPAGTFPPKP